MQAAQDGAFPMTSYVSRASSARSQASSARSRSTEKSTLFPYSKHYNDNDTPRPMCGQTTLTKILAASPGVRSRQTERTSLLSPSTDGSKPYEPLPYDVTPMDDIYSADSSDFNQNFPEPEPSDAMIYIPQFNVNKARQVQAKTRQPTSRHRLASVAEVSRDDTDQVSGNASEDSSISSASSPRKGASPAVRLPPPRERKSTKDRRLEQMIRSMQEVIMQQEENIRTLGMENAHYRENMASFQEHVMNLKKEQVDQKNEIHKLHFERESYEAETTSLREELKTMRSELIRSKSERGTWSTRDLSSVQKEAQWMTIVRGSTAKKAVPWMPKNQVDSLEDPESFYQQKQPEENAVKKQSVSFNEHNEVYKQCVQERDDAPSDMRWERSRQRSVFNKVARDFNTTTAQSQVSKTDETRDASTKISKASSSGKCSDLQELQARANELRETVAKMKLDSPKNSDQARFSPPPKSSSADTSSSARYDARKRDVVLRYSRGESGMSYWNSHDMNNKGEHE